MSFINRFKETKFLDLEHKIGIAVFVLLTLVAIPVTVVSVKKTQDDRSHAAEPQNNLQLGYFDPSYFGVMSSVAHVDNEVLVRYNNSVNIKTRTGVNPSTDTFQVADITGGLPNNTLNNLKSLSVASIESAYKEPTAQNTQWGKTYISNTYRVKLNQGQDLVAAMNKLCSDGKVTMYCEPNYKFTPATNPNGGQTSPTSGKVLAATTTNQSRPSALIAIVDTPLPVNYNDIANAFGFSISNSQIQPAIEGTRDDNYKYHAIFAAAAGYATNPGVKYIFEGACGTTCSNSSLAQGIIDAVNKNAKVIYIGEANTFPKGVVPMSIASAVGYAVANGAKVVAPIVNPSSPTSMNSLPNTTSFIDKVLTFAHKITGFPPIAAAQGLLQPVPSSVQNSINTYAPKSSSQLQNALSQYATGNTGAGIAQNNPNTILISPQDTGIITQLVKAVNPNASAQDVQNLIKNSQTADANGRIDASTILQEASQLSSASNGTNTSNKQTSPAPSSAPTQNANGAKPSTTTPPCTSQPSCSPGVNAVTGNTTQAATGAITMPQAIQSIQTNSTGALQQLGINSSQLQSGINGNSIATGNGAAAYGILLSANPKLTNAQANDIIAANTKVQNCGGGGSQPACGIQLGQAVQDALGTAYNPPTLPPTAPAASTSNPPSTDPIITVPTAAAQTAYQTAVNNGDNLICQACGKNGEDLTFNQMTGQPYYTDDARTWYLAQIGLTPTGANATSATANPVVQPIAAVSVPLGSAVTGNPPAADSNTQPPKSQSSTAQSVSDLNQLASDIAAGKYDNLSAVQKETMFVNAFNANNIDVKDLTPAQAQQLQADLNTYHDQITSAQDAQASCVVNCSTYDSNATDQAYQNWNSLSNQLTQTGLTDPCAGLPANMPCGDGGSSSNLTQNSSGVSTCGSVEAKLSGTCDQAANGTVSTAPTGDQLRSGCVRVGSGISNDCVDTWVGNQVNGLINGIGTLTTDNSSQKTYASKFDTLSTPNPDTVAPLPQSSTSDNILYSYLSPYDSSTSNSDTTNISQEQNELLAQGQLNYSDISTPGQTDLTNGANGACSDGCISNSDGTIYDPTTDQLLGLDQTGVYVPVAGPPTPEDIPYSDQTTAVSNDASGIFSGITNIADQATQMAQGATDQTADAAQNLIDAGFPPDGSPNYADNGQPIYDVAMPDPGTFIPTDQGGCDPTYGCAY
ncbi:MAG TPA: hypothetical protein VG965_05000 [Patescibacteria group bacterium]|nr:hypothetical protein [Patescibacteria group bacterium]